VNLYLHGFTDPHVYEYDTLTQEERWNEFADVILANPPFMSPKGGIKPHKRFSIQSRRSEVLFLDYFIEHLTATGRAGVIVPEGIHFVAQSGHTELRRALIDNGLLLADITLPHGVFKPYASVKTHILILDRLLARKTDSVLFIEIENDGYSQSDILAFKAAVSKATGFAPKASKMRSYTVIKKKLLATDSCHLLGRWHDLPNRVIHRKDIPLRSIAQLCEIRDGLSPNMATKPGDHVMVVPAEDRKTADHWDFEGTGICIPLVSSAGHGKADIKRLHYQEGRFALADTMCALFVKDTENALLTAKADSVYPRYLHIFLSAMCNELLVPLMCGATNVTMSSTQLADILIPIPHPSKQVEVIESHLAETQGKAILTSATALRDSSRDNVVVSLANRVINDVDKLLHVAQKRLSVRAFIPNGSNGSAEL
jgi:hypothetical protein